MDVENTSARRWGPLLVALQFVLLALLAWQALAAPAKSQLPPGAAMCMLAGVLLGVWAISANRPGNFNIRPQPREGGRLIEQGPYRWIRHPMYSALMLAGLAAAWIAATAAGWAALLGLAVVLAMKARVEEAAMLQAHAGYRDYRRRTKRFVPGLY